MSLLMASSPSDDDNALCDVDNLSIKTRYSSGLTAYMKTCLQ